MANTGSFIAWGLLFSLGAGVPAASGDLINGARMAGSAFRELAYPGAEVLRDFQSVVNQVPVSTALFSTRAPVTAVRAYYSARLEGAGWIREAGAEKAERNEVLVDAGGGYMVATRNDRTLRVHLLPAGKAGKAGGDFYLPAIESETNRPERFSARRGRGKEDPSHPALSGGARGFLPGRRPKFRPDAGHVLYHGRSRRGFIILREKTPSGGVEAGVFLSHG
ncbi:MAG: hypothetical protein M1379_17490 [Firmicutes bacterium]|nr:hypothetical protein [Bacillota bacterium]